MSMKRLSVVLLGSLAIALLLWGAPGKQIPSPPTAPLFTPTSLVRSGNTNRLRLRYEEAVLRLPKSVEAHVDLAQFYLHEARRTSDEPTFVPMARRELGLALDMDPSDYRARVQLGVLNNKLHQFEKAEAIATQLIQDHPGHAFNYGTLVDALVELGRYDEAVQTLDTMMSLRPDLSSYSRVSYVRQLHGDYQGALRAMEMAVESGAIGSDGRSWALFQLGNLLTAGGKLEAADHAFSGLLEETPGYTSGLAGLARVRLLMGRSREAARLIEEAMALAPAAGFEHLALEIYKTRGDANRSATMEDAIDSQMAAAATMGENVRMEQADLWADSNRRLDEALELATMEIERRPDHLHANETLAWVLYRLGRSAEALAYIDHAMRLDSGDAKLTYRAGMIYLATGRSAPGLALIRQALDEGLNWESPFTAAAARSVLAERS
jgi:pentatricopeptide repeat protein